jgi:hypothetical protein
VKVRHIEVDVEELVLRGVPPHQAPAVAAAIEAELADQPKHAAVEAAGVTGREEAFRRLPAVDAPGDPAGLGQAVAAAVWADLTGPRVMATSTSAGSRNTQMWPPSRSSDSSLDRPESRR